MDTIRNFIFSSRYIMNTVQIPIEFIETAIATISFSLNCNLNVDHKNLKDTLTYFLELKRRHYKRESDAT